MIAPELLTILCCPESHQALRPAEATLLDDLNRTIAACGVRNRAGEMVTEKLDGGLVRADGKYLFPIRREIPVMLVKEMIPLTDATGA